MLAVHQKAQEDLQAASTAQEAAAAVSEEEKSRIRAVWVAAEEQKKVLEGKVALAAGCLKAADELKEARCMPHACALAG